VNSVTNITVLTTTNGFVFALQTCQMFKIRLKFDCSLIYLSAQLRKSSFIFKSAVLLKNKD